MHTYVCVSPHTNMYTQGLMGRGRARDEASAREKESARMSETNAQLTFVLAFTLALWSRHTHAQKGERSVFFFFGFFFSGSCFAKHCVVGFCSCKQIVHMYVCVCIHTHNTCTYNYFKIKCIFTQRRNFASFALLLKVPSCVLGHTATVPTAASAE